jgi:hypothetical protein
MDKVSVRIEIPSKVAVYVILVIIYVLIQTPVL